jgi:GNAT superfamily N-acetyltransferase
MDSPPARRSTPRKGLEVSQASVPAPELNHFFFTTVGRPWKWYSRLDWTYDTWTSYVSDPRTLTYIAYQEGTPVGYLELNEQAEENIEIAFYGLLPRFLGNGLGRAFLSRAIQIAWDRTPKRVWVHTCSLDHPAALPNYLARGFRIYREETKLTTIPEDDDPLWRTPRFYEERIFPGQLK